MQKMFVDRFTLKRFFDDFRDETYIDMFKKCREAYEKDQDEKKYGKYRKIVLENLNFLIGEKDQKSLMFIWIVAPLNFSILFLMLK